MKINNLKYLFLSAMIAGCSSLFVSCEEELEVGNVIDETAYQDIYTNNIYLRDVNTNKTSAVVELHKDSYETSLMLGLSKNASASTMVKVKVNPDYLAAYNKEHNTDFEMYPQELVSFENDGTFTIDPEKRKAEVKLTINGGKGIEANKTYAIPVSIVENSSDVVIKNENAKNCMYLVKDMRQNGDCFKGEGKLKGYLVVETNDINPLNALSFQLENGKYLWDVVVLFAANINYKEAENRVYLHCNRQTRFLLENYDSYIKPLQDRGIKVVLGVLGNHDIAGVAQLSELGARQFAKELAAYCKTYNLDGVMFDDEYSKRPIIGHPLLDYACEYSAARLCYECRMAMPDKLITIYDCGAMYNHGTTPGQYKGMYAKDFIDIVVPDYPTTTLPVESGKMGYDQCAGIAMQFPEGSIYDLNEDRVQWLNEKGYGWFMGYAPYPRKFTDIWNRLTGTTLEYGCKMKAPTIYYKHEDPNPYPWDASVTD